VAAAGTSKDLGAADALRRMSSVALENKHLHDAIELVASVGMGGHPNIVQVPYLRTWVLLLGSAVDVRVR
jgi:hypothetical protein